MSRFAPATLVWVGSVTLVTLVITLQGGLPLATAAAAWPGFVVLTVCGAVAHLFPVRSGFGGASYRLTNVFVIAGAATLPPELVTPLAVLVVTPERWLRRGRAGALIGLVFNVSQTALAAHVGAAWAAWGNEQLTFPGGSLLTLLGTGAVFTATQELLVGVVIALSSRVPLHRADNFTAPALLTNSLLALLGVAVAGLWLAAPELLLLLVPMLIVVHRLTRNAQLAYLAQIDAKTGLHNFRYFEQVLQEELARSRRLNRPLGLLFIDLDHFKRVNDQYGHAAGDHVLQEIAALLKATVRKGDLVARFGGEEFVVLLPGTDGSEACYLAERLRVAVADHLFTLENGAVLCCTASIGVATCPDDGSDAGTLLKHADAALYRAKQTRNAVAELGRSSKAPASSPAAEPAAKGASPLASLVVWGTIGAGILALGWSLVLVGLSARWWALLPFLLLAVVAELLYVRVYDGGEEKISVSFTIAVAMAAAVALPAGAPLVYLVASSVHQLLSQQWDLRKALFNLTNPALAAMLATITYDLLGPSESYFSLLHLGAAGAAVTVFHLTNAGLLALVISLHSGRSFPQMARQLIWYAPTKFFLGLTGAFLGGAYSILGLLGTAMFVVPLLIMRFTLVLYARESQKTIGTLRALNQQLETEISERERIQDAFLHQALYDSLTDLPNRISVQQQLFEHARSPAPAGGQTALLLLDLDRFKEINDTFGHEFGDLLLKQVGLRLQGNARASDMVGRLGGDEFAVVLPDITREEALESGRRVLQELERPFTIGGHALPVAASIGIALCPDDGLNPDLLLRRADMAMYTAKGRGMGVAMYTPEQDRSDPDRLALIGELREAVKGNELVLHYQAKVSCATGQLESVEALVRWPHATRGFVPPDQFIPLAEQTGLIQPLSTWVLNAALSQCRAWLDAGLKLPIAVNLSMRNLQDPALPELIARLLAAWDVPAPYLRVEITESALMAEPSVAVEVLTRLREIGLLAAVDDFGTGYSSLSYLKRLPVDELKIDKLFVGQMTVDHKDAAIVQSAIHLAHALGLQTVAEGVEDRATFDLLGTFGCDLIQGYYVSPPVPAADVMRLARNVPRSNGVSRAVA